MAKYEVVRPWFGVKVGDVVELKELHPALKSNVRLMKGEAGGELKPATPDAGTGEKSRKEIIQNRLTELGIEFKGTLGADKLSELLPDGELEKLFPAESQPPRRRVFMPRSGGVFHGVDNGNSRTGEGVSGEPGNYHSRFCSSGSRRPG